MFELLDELSSLDGGASEDGFGDLSFTRFARGGL